MIGRYTSKIACYSVTMTVKDCTCKKVFVHSFTLTFFYDENLCYKSGNKTTSWNNKHEWPIGHNNINRDCNLPLIIPFWYQSANGVVINDDVWNTWKSDCCFSCTIKCHDK